MDRYDQLGERLEDKYSLEEFSVLTGRTVETVRNWLESARDAGIEVEMETVRVGRRQRRIITRQGAIALLRHMQFPVV